jgi:hypothetical protein
MYQDEELFNINQYNYFNYVFDDSVEVYEDITDEIPELIKKYNVKFTKEK